jgi:hypothetical protein
MDNERTKRTKIILFSGQITLAEIPRLVGCGVEEIESSVSHLICKLPFSAAMGSDATSFEIEALNHCH